MQFIDGPSLAEIMHELITARRKSSATNGHSDNDSVTVPSISAETKREIQAAITTMRTNRPDSYIRNVAAWGVQAAHGLAFAHESGILHRDIKPGNLLIDTGGKLWITDFGLARIEKDATLTLTGDLLGTLRYMSPEQALAKCVLADQRSDLYSLGITLYEMLALQPAFSGSDRHELLKSIAFEEPPRLRVIDPAIPAELETIIHKSAAKDPADRYLSAQELADDLQRFIDHRPIRARPPTVLDRAAKWSRRNVAILWTGATAAVLVSIVLVAATIVSTRQARRAIEEERRAAAAFVIAADRLQIARDAVDQMYTEVAEKWLSQDGELETLQEQFLKQALAIYEAFAAEEHENVPAAIAAVRARHRVARIYHRLGQFHDSEVAFRKTISEYRTIEERVGGSDPLRFYFSGAMLDFADYLISAQRPEEAESLLKEAISNFSSLAIAQPDNLDVRTNLAGSFHNLGNIYLEQQRYDEAIAALQEGHALTEATWRSAAQRPHRRLFICPIIARSW